MTDDQLAAILSFGLPTIMLCFFLLGHRMGRSRATNVMTLLLEEERVQRIERWTPPPAKSYGEPGTSERLVSDYEDAIYTETRHAAFAQVGEANEEHHLAVAAQLHADVRYLRGQVLADILAKPSSVEERVNVRSSDGTG